MLAEETIFQWLKDAHAMETSIEEVLECRVKEPSHDPAIQRRLQQHLQETREHAGSIRHCLETNGEESSSGTSILGDFMAKIQGMATTAAEDQRVKNGLMDYATEHFEIACYTSLIAAAEKAGMRDVAAVCRAILAEEEEMADWLSREIPLITEQFLDREETKERAEDQPSRHAAGG